ncbi:hypothetical protein [Nonomuraea polychroma]|uniref:AraC-like ligand-binding domain-containing protein n=1 Tax=Nonomuraea polychroma TaxID=46176 RepID=UPI0019D43A88|nr:hypothetical protein [Nonomuraea polychroma]
MTIWNDWVTGTDVRRELISSDGGDLSTGTRVVDLGVVVLAVKRFRPANLKREADRMRAEGEDIIQLILPLHGTVNATWAGRQDTVSVGDLYAHDLAQLQEMSLRSDGRDALELALVAIPKPVLPLPGGVINSALGHSMPGDRGMSALLKRFIEKLSDEKLSLNAADHQRLGTVLVALVTACFSSLLESRPALRPGPHGRPSPCASAPTFSAICTIPS